MQRRGQRDFPVPFPQRAGRECKDALSSLRSAVQASADATDPAQSLNAARDSLAKSQIFASSLAASRRATEALAQQTPKKTVVTALPVAPGRTATAAKPAAEHGDRGNDDHRLPGVSPGKIAQFNAIIDGARGMAKQVIRMGDRSSNATRKSNAVLARNYEATSRT